MINSARQPRVDQTAPEVWEWVVTVRITSPSPWVLWPQDG